MKGLDDIRKEFKDMLKEAVDSKKQSAPAANSAAAGNNVGNADSSLWRQLQETQVCPRIARFG